MAQKALAANVLQASSSIRSWLSLMPVSSGASLCVKHRKILQLLSFYIYIYIHTYIHINNINGSGLIVTGEATGSRTEPYLLPPQSLEFDTNKIYVYRHTL